jgi:hypothetical protein
VSPRLVHQDGATAFSDNLKNRVVHSAVGPLNRLSHRIQIGSLEHLRGPRILARRAQC